MLENEDKSSLNDGKTGASAGEPAADAGQGKSAVSENTIEPPDTEKSPPLPTKLSDALQGFRQRFGMPKNQDIVIRNFRIGRKIGAALVFIEGMVDKRVINQSLLPRLMSTEITNEVNPDQAADFLMENVIPINQLKKETRYCEIVKQILNGMSALLIDGCAECILIEARGYEKRAVDSPKTESVIKGSQEGFTETMRTNITMLRRIIKNEHLISELVTVGKTNASNCAVLYLEGIADPRVVKEVKKRMRNVDSDFILGEGALEQFIQDNSFTLFPQVLSTERPDRAASFLMNGQVIVIADGTPFVMGVPVTLFELFHTSEDSSVRWPYGAFLRLIRLFGFFSALLLPGVYTAVVLFHSEVIPTELQAAVAAAREPVPFPTVIEVILLETSFELIREGAIRVPGVIGQTLGIVGALILGQSAVAAQLVSPVLVIVVSITALGSFTIPNYSISLAVRIARFLFIFAGASFGFFGISVLMFLLMCVVCGMKSFGVPFLSPIAPRTHTGGSTLLRDPLWSYKRRPDFLQASDQKRQAENVRAWISVDPNSKEPKP